MATDVNIINTRKSDLEELSESDYESEKEDAREYIENEWIKMQSAENKAQFFRGIKFQMRLDTFEIRLMIPRREIVRYNEVYPNWHFKVQGFCIKLGFVGDSLAA